VATGLSVDFRIWKVVHP